MTGRFQTLVPIFVRLFCGILRRCKTSHGEYSGATQTHHIEELADH